MVIIVCHVFSENEWFDAWNSDAASWSLCQFCRYTLVEYSGKLFDINAFNYLIIVCYVCMLDHFIPDSFVLLGNHKSCNCIW